MCFAMGQGVLGKIRFKDGEMPQYDRTYLIVNVADEYIEVLNVSSVRGKERKLAFSSNEQLRCYNPPFLKPSFVKLDSLTRIEQTEWGNLSILHNGAALDQNELARIKSLIQ